MSKHLIKRLPVETGRSGWEAISCRQFPLTELDSHVQADWLIIGAGFAGLSAARRITQLRPGERVVVLDACQVAEGPAGRNSGYMIDVPHNISSGDYSVGDASATKLEIAQSRQAISFAKEVAKEYGFSSTTFDPSGKTNAASTERGKNLNDNFAKSLSRIGEPYTRLSAVEMRDLTGTDYYIDGIHTAGTVMIQPAEYIRGLAKGLRQRVDIYENSPVIELESFGELWRARTPKGSVTAPKAILGVNGHIQNFGHYKGRLMHLFTYASMTAPFTGKAGLDRWALLPADPMGATVRKVTNTDGSRIVIRTYFTYSPSIEVTERHLVTATRKHRKSFDARFPDLAGLGFDYSWGGRICLSWNHVPAFGEVERGLYSAACENGLGTVKSTLAGIMAAELATGTHSQNLADFLALPQPSRIPPEPFATLGATAMIRFQELRAGREG